MALEELYQDIILDHYRRPRHRGSCAGCAAVVHHDNPLCGDEIHLGVDVRDGRIVRIAYEGQGCSISQAAASMMTEAVQGAPVADALALTEAVRRMMHGEPPESDLGDVMALEGVAQFPVRVKCALLPWMALRDALGRAGAASGSGERGAESG